MKKSNDHFLLGMLYLMFAQIMVGVNIVFSKYVLVSLPILFVLTIRFTLASIILLPLHWLTPAKSLSIRHYFLQLTRKDWGFIMAQALSAGVLFNCLMLWGLQDTDANVAGIITSALPAMIALLSWVMLGEKISTKKCFCIGFATIGLVVIAYDKFDGFNGTHSFFGDAIILISLLPEAAYYILTKMHTSPLPVFLISSLLN